MLLNTTCTVTFCRVYGNVILDLLVVFQQVHPPDSFLFNFWVPTQAWNFIECTCTYLSVCKCHANIGIYIFMLICELFIKKTNTANTVCLEIKKNQYMFLLMHVYLSFCLVSYQWYISQKTESLFEFKTSFCKIFKMASSGLKGKCCFKQQCCQEFCPSYISPQW